METYPSRREKDTVMREQTNGEDPDSLGWESVECLTGFQQQRLMEAFRIWREAATRDYIRKVRGRYWLAFLVLRFTGARIGEILSIDDSVDIDYHLGEIHILRAGSSREKQLLRTVPVPPEVISELVAYLDAFPGMRGRVFALDQGNFRREFYRRAEEAEIPRVLSHPHILRHTRAVEMLRAGVPLTTVQDLLGHMLRSSTAIYLPRSEITARRILMERGLL